MTTEEDVIGMVTEMLPDLKYRVLLEGSEREVICYTAGKLKLHKIRILVGDKVRVILDPYKGKATNRIIRRIDKERV
jgi:translation initiation factor IF-1